MAGAFAGNLERDGQSVLFLKTIRPSLCEANVKAKLPSVVVSTLS